MIVDDTRKRDRQIAIETRGFIELDRFFAFGRYFFSTFALFPFLAAFLAFGTCIGWSLGHGEATKK